MFYSPHNNPTYSLINETVRNTRRYVSTPIFAKVRPSTLGLASYDAVYFESYDTLTVYHQQELSNQRTATTGQRYSAEGGIYPNAGRDIKKRPKSGLLNFLVPHFRPSRHELELKLLLRCRGNWQSSRLDQIFRFKII